MKSQQILQNGRYRISQEMGKGGMGVIYQGRDNNLQGRHVAIKENLDDSRDSQRQFQREAVILAKLNHPNLPRVSDYFIEPSGRQYLIMDYVEGMDLKDIVRKIGPLPERDVLLWTKQVMDALEYLHNWVDPDTKKPTPVIHRDIKPSNIRRRPGNQIMLVDFGIAKVGATGTWAGARSITPGYSPVEQYGDETDARSDIYALGATLYYLLTGVAPPEAHKDVPPVRKLNPDITMHTARVIQRAMQKSVHERYQSVNEMSEALFDPTWWERIDLPASGSVLPRIGDVLTGRTTEPRSTRSRSTGSRRTGSGRTGSRRTERTASQRQKTASQKPGSAPDSASPAEILPTRRRSYRKSGLLILLFTVIVIGAAWIFMSMTPAPASPSRGTERPPRAIALITDTVTPLPTDTLTATSTPTSLPSATSTSVSTPTPEPDPTITTVVIEAVSETNSSTSTPAPTWTISPTDTPTAIQTATNTLTPVPAATLPPSSTPIPSSTLTPTPLPTFTPVPTQTATPTSLPTATPVPTSTATHTATSTLRPSPTPSSTLPPTPSSTLPPKPTHTPTATHIPFRLHTDAFSLGDRSDSVNVELLTPLSTVLQGSEVFSWKLSGLSLEENQAYEVIFWDQDGKVAYSLGDPGLTATDRLTIKLDGAIEELALLKSGDRYRWGIALVQVNPHKRLAYLGGGQLFRLKHSRD